MRESEQTKEFTLGVGKLLGLFFFVAVLCAISFVFGYSYGRSKQAAAPDSLASQPNPPAKPAKPVPPGPSAAKCPEGENCQAPGIPSSQDLSFYKSVQKKKEAVAPLAPAKPAHQPSPASARQPAVRQAPPQRPSSPQMAKASPPAPPKPQTSESPVLSGVMVQVAAVRKREDAEVLQEALRRKQYPVVITTGTSDRLYHVQIGPFADTKEAELTRSRLQGEGYSPILKK